MSHVDLGLELADLDRFRSVTDALGHAAGDNLLRRVTGRLSDCGGLKDTLARLSGNEFGVRLARLSATTPQ